MALTVKKSSHVQILSQFLYARVIPHGLNLTGAQYTGTPGRPNVPEAAENAPQSPPQTMPEAPRDSSIGLGYSGRDRGVAATRRFSGGLGALSRKRSLIHGTKSDFDVRTPMYPRSNSLLPGLSTIP